MKAVIYARVSTASQTEGTSLQSQIEACEKYAKENGFQVVRTYQEVGSGASLVDRSLINDLRRDAKNGLFSTVICYAVDRLSRSISHLFILLDEFDRYAITANFITEPLDRSPEGKLLQSVKGYVAEVEREKIRERTMRGRKTHAINGTLSYRRKLYGYQLDDSGRRVLDGLECDNVSRMFRAVLEGKSVRAIAAEFNREGIVTPKGSRIWWGNSIHSIITNPSYTGRSFAFRYRHDIKYVEGRKKRNGSVIRPEKEWIELPGYTPAIIDQETFDAVQRQLQINKKAKRREVKHQFLLRGFVRCANCGRQFTPHTSKNSRRYSCSSIQNPAVNCHTKSLQADKAEDAVWIKALEIISGLTIDPPKPKTGPDPLPKIDQQISRIEREMCLIVERSAKASERTWEMFQRELDKKADEIEKVQKHRAEIVKQQSMIPKAESLKSVRARYKKNINNLPFEQRVNVLKDLGTTCTWDGETLNVNIYAV